MNGQKRSVQQNASKWNQEAAKKAKGNWVEELPSVLWSYRTTPRVHMKETPFGLTYDTEAMLPMELTIGSLRTTYFKEADNDKDLRANLDLIKEKCERSNIHQATYKNVVERYYNQRVNKKDFKVGNYVLR